METVMLVKSAEINMNLRKTGIWEQLPWVLPKIPFYDYFYMA